MKSKAKTITEYIKELPADRIKPVKMLREVIKKNIPKGFKEEINYGMIGYVVPHSIYPDGYHCNPEQPLPFVCLASQKNFIAIYHMALYSDPKLYSWFVKEYSVQSKQKLDMGKSCLRFKKFDQIPYKLLGDLMKKITVKDYIKLYETALMNSRKKK